jgi:hypothetical protein
VVAGKSTRAEPAREHYPRIIERHGKMPPQYPNWEDESEGEDDWEEEDDETSTL